MENFQYNVQNNNFIHRVAPIDRDAIATKFPERRKQTVINSIRKYREGK